MSQRTRLASALDDLGTTRPYAPVTAEQAAAWPPIAYWPMRCTPTCRDGDARFRRLTGMGNDSCGRISLVCCEYDRARSGAQCDEKPGIERGLCVCRTRAWHAYDRSYRINDSSCAAWPSCQLPWAQTIIVGDAVAVENTVVVGGSVAVAVADADAVYADVNGEPGLAAEHGTPGATCIVRLRIELGMGSDVRAGDSGGGGRCRGQQLRGGFRHAREPPDPGPSPAACGPETEEAAVSRSTMAGSVAAATAA
jgi:hypothetical protein